jgi:glutathione S-transferase
MYTLFWSPGSASMAPHFCLEEAGAPYTLRRVDMGKGENQSAEYLALNPAGKVPVLAIDNGFVMTESAAICMLLADRHPAAGLAPAADELARGHYYQWLLHLSNTVQPAMLRFYYPDRHVTEAANAPQVTDKAREEITTLWSRIDAHLQAKGPYLLGARYSAADAFCTMLATWTDPCPEAAQRFPALQQLVERVLARPAIQRVMQVNQAA